MKNRVRITRAEIEQAKEHILKSKPLEQKTDSEVYEKKYKYNNFIL